MDSNTSSDTPPVRPPGGFPGGLPADLATLLAAVDGLASAQQLAGQPEVVLAERVRVLRWLGDRVEGQWLSELAGVDARGAAGAEDGVEAGSTAGWLRRRLRLGAGAAASSVRTARALFRGPLTQTAQALCDGELSPAHAAVLAAGHPVAARAPDCRGRAGPGGGGPAAGPTPAAAGRWASGGGGRPRGG